eukprot:Skav206357  [mRNA]  locus=scaffold3448:224728:225655:- [translate_table: standard]
MRFPENSSGDLFRLLPFEGYKQVVSFLPVELLPSAYQVSKAWQRAVASRAKVDESFTCRSLQDLTLFLQQLPNSATAIRCDVSRITAGSACLLAQLEILVSGGLEKTFFSGFPQCWWRWQLEWMSD